MARITVSFCARAADAIGRAPSDPGAATEVLRIAAGYLRRGEPLPANLADYLADAIEAAMAKPAEHRLSALGLELNLTASNRRPAAHWVDIAHRCEELQDGTRSTDAVANDVAAEFGIGVSTAKRYWQAFRNAKKPD